MTKLGDWAAIASIASIVGLIITGYIHLDEEHADKIETKKSLLNTELQLRQEINNRDIKKDAEARSHYKSLEQNRALEPAEASRVDYLEEQLEQKYQEQQMLEEAEQRLKEQH